MLDEMDKMEYINNLAAVLQEYTANRCAVDMMEQDKGVEEDAAWRMEC